jgi:hypothetical protein
VIERPGGVGDDHRPRHRNDEGLQHRVAQYQQAAEQEAKNDAAGDFFGDLVDHGGAFFRRLGLILAREARWRSGPIVRAPVAEGLMRIGKRGFERSSHACLFVPG